jgi:hypothetical protein
VASGPRIIFVPAVDVASVAGGGFGWRPSGGEGIATRYGWRLIGANNRELGRSPVTYAGLIAAREKAAELRDRADAVTGQVDNDPRDGSWGWRGSLAGVVVATSGRRYQRHRECAYNFRQFVSALSEAIENLSPVTTVRIGRPAESPMARPGQRPPYEPVAPR